MRWPTGPANFPTITLHLLLNKMTYNIHQYPIISYSWFPWHCFGIGQVTWSRLWERSKPNLKSPVPPLPTKPPLEIRLCHRISSPPVPPRCRRPTADKRQRGSNFITTWKFGTNEICHSRSSQCLCFWHFLAIFGGSQKKGLEAVSKLRASLDPCGAPRIQIKFRMADSLMWFPVVFYRMQDMKGQCMWETEVPWVARRDPQQGCVWKLGAFK